MSTTRRPHFFHVFSSNLSTERLKLPERFVKHLESGTSGSVSLTGPSGNTWHINLSQQNDGLFFCSGWPTFVGDHLIECGDLLVFRYDGELHFTVQVFDQSACEKEAAFHTKCSQEGSKYDKNVGQKREREEVAVLNKDSQGMSKKIRESTSELQTEYIDKNQETDVHIAEVTVHRGTGKEDDLDLHNRGCMCTLSNPEEKKVAESFTSSFPYFVRTMKRFNVSGSYTLNVPYQFSMEHLPKFKTEIVLRNLKGVCWTVNSVPTTRVHTSHTFCGGWLGFVRSNEIKMGDICIFELVGKCELRVHIFRVGKEDIDSQGEKAACNGLNVLSTASHKIFEGVPMKMIRSSPKVHSKSLKNIQICDKKGSKTHDKRKPGSATKKSGQISKAETEKPVAGLRLMVALDEQKAARSFTSGFPNFVRIMRKFNISGSFTLKIPYQFSMAHLPDCKTEIVLRNLRGESWTVNSVPDSKGRMVHTFCGGWMAFVRGNDIKMGDVCIFELINKCEMRVHISGYGRKGIEHQNGKSACNEMHAGSATGDCPNF